MVDEEPDPNERRRRPDDPFDIFRGFGLSGRDFERLFDEMQRSISNALKDIGDIQPGKPYVHGFSFKIGPDGKPQVSEFGHRPTRPMKGKPIMSEEREPLTDVIQEAKSVAVTVEMPGIEKKDIDLRVTATELEITVDNEKRKYHKLIQLPAKVKAQTTKATYKNGILDVTIEKESPAEPKKGFRVSVE